MESRLIKLGQIASAHGIRGQVKIRSFTAVPEDMTAYGPLRDKSGKTYGITITSKNKDVLIADVEGVKDRDQADALRNVELFVPRSALPTTDKHEYYYEDLVGLEVTTPDGKKFGTITAVNNFGAGDLITMKLASGEEEIYPFTRTTFPTIDIVKKMAVIEPPMFIETEQGEEPQE